jgi:processive 1,2-diacylglycerol beta-glucosyltransferase
MTMAKTIAGESRREGASLPSLRVPEATIAPAPPPARVLIVTTDIGEGHDLPARQLAEGLQEESPGVQTAIVDGVEAMGKLLSLILKDNSRAVFRMPGWMFDLQHWVVVRFPPTRAIAALVNYTLGHRGMLRLIRRAAPDVIVSTYPGTTAVLARLRRRGRLQTPIVSAITDLAELRYWAEPGVDLHLATHEESIPEVRRIAPQSRIAWVRGLTSPGFTEPADPAAGRREFGLPDGAPVIVVSGGGWGVGDLEGAVTESLASDPRARVVILCGRNEELKARMEAAFGAEPRVHVSGFTNHMSALFAAADVLVHSTAGLTVLEAWIRGCRVVSYGWGVAHIRANNRGFAEHRIARVARTREELRQALTAALADPRIERHETFAALPSAASAVLELVPAANRTSLNDGYSRHSGTFEPREGARPFDSREAV